MTLISVTAFDPAITDMGWANLSYDTETKTFDIIEVGTIDGTKLSRGFPKFAKMFPSSFRTAYRLKDVVTGILSGFKPHYVSSEGVYSGRFPQAGFTLTIVVFVIRNVCYDLMEQAPFIIAPSETKLVVTGRGGAKKPDIKKSITTRKDITFSMPGRKITELTEHEYDAVGHGMAFCTLRLKTLLEEEAKVVELANVKALKKKKK